MLEKRESQTKERKKKRKLYIRILGGVLIFICAAFGVNYYIGQEQGSMMTVPDNPSYPVMEISSEGGDYNLMPAYESEIDLSLVRNQVTAVESGSPLNLKLHCYDYDITAIQYVLFEESPENAVEEGTINQLETMEENEDVRLGKIPFKTALNRNRSYYLKLAVRLNAQTQVFFYTKIQNATDYHFENYLTFAKEFHENLFDKNAIESCQSYLEPSTAATDKDLNTVNIRSTVNSVFYGGLELTEVTEPRIKVKELNKVYAVLEVSSTATLKDGGEDAPYYNITEVYKLRYTATRMYLLDYQRTMGEIYDGTLIHSEKNYLGLGIQSDDRVSYLASNDGRLVCFVTEKQLWYYDHDASTVSKVYSLTADDLSDVHNNAGGSGIKLLKMEDNGDIVYCIYGYIDRGSDEGKNGIAVMKYDASENYSEKAAFLETSVPFDIMKQDLNKCAYFNDNDEMYCLLDGDLHKISLADQEDEIVASGIINESLTASKDGTIVALEKNRDLTKNRQIDLLNLETGKTVTISSGQEERIRAAGFILNDFIYLVAKESEVAQEKSGSLCFPASSVHIVNGEGEEIRTYEKNKKYIMDTEINGSALEMTMASKKNGRFVTDKKKGYLHYKQEEEEAGVSLTQVFSNTYWNQLYVTFPEKVYIKVAPKLSYAPIKVSEEEKKLLLEKSDTVMERYFVYAKGELQEECSSLSEAIVAADELRGNVIDNEENILWQCAFSSYAKVSGMTSAGEKVANKDSLKACLRMISKASGKNMEEDQIDTQKKSVMELMEDCTGKRALNLTGSSLEYVFYYIDQGMPVLARTSNAKYIVIMSYNEKNVRYLDPVTAESTVVTISTLKNALQTQGNVMYSYIGD